MEIKNPVLTLCGVMLCLTSFVIMMFSNIVYLRYKHSIAIAEEQEFVGPLTKEEFVTAKAKLLEEWRETPEDEMDTVVISCVCGQHTRLTSRQFIAEIENEGEDALWIIDAIARDEKYGRCQALAKS